MLWGACEPAFQGLARGFQNGTRRHFPSFQEYNSEISAPEHLEPSGRPTSAFTPSGCMEAPPTWDNSKSQANGERGGEELHGKDRGLIPPNPGRESDPLLRDLSHAPVYALNRNPSMDGRSDPLLSTPHPILPGAFSLDTFGAKQSVLVQDCGCSLSAASGIACAFLYCYRTL